MMANNKNLSEFPYSLWGANIKPPHYESLTTELSCDFTIIGGGIAGLTTALLLQEAGFKTALVEARTLASGASGHTTAKITSQHQVNFSKLFKKVGKHHAAVYAKASVAGSNLIKNLVQKYEIDCDYQTKDSYVYAITEQELDLLKREQSYALEAGLTYAFINHIPSLPFAISGALKLANQAQFNPVKYLYGLADAYTELGGLIYEHSRVIDINFDKFIKIFTPNGKLTSEKVIIASHFPIKDLSNAYPARLHGQRSYIIALRTTKNLPKGMFISASEPILSLRTMQYQNENLLLAGGSGHRTGIYKSQLSPYETLYERTKEYYANAELVGKWSAQDYITLDQVPYIGQLSICHKNAYIATGFGKWGMSLGSASALLINSLILKATSPWKKTFTPLRADILWQPGSVINNGFCFAKHFISDRFTFNTVEIEDISPDTGGIINNDGSAIGVYLHPDGTYYAVKPYCTHLGCLLHWNQAERSWDCPCHASRFTYTGEIIESPARTKLQTINLKEQQL